MSPLSDGDELHLSRAAMGTGSAFRSRGQRGLQCKENGEGGFEHLEQLRIEREETLLGSFAGDPQLHPRPVDPLPRSQGAGFHQSQPRGIDRHEKGAIAQPTRRMEDRLNLLNRIGMRAFGLAFDPCQGSNQNAPLGIESKCTTFGVGLVSGFGWWWARVFGSGWRQRSVPSMFPLEEGFGVG